jgi:formylglycine-generating enzyme
MQPGSTAVVAGKLQEWCWDWYSASYYNGSPGTDPRGPATGLSRSIRDGSWGHFAHDCRVASRSSGTPANMSANVGFRTLLPPGL